MRPRSISIAANAIPANLVVATLNIFLTITIPFGIWRGFSESQFVTILLSMDACVWLIMFSWMMFRNVNRK